MLNMIKHILISGDDNPNYLQYLPVTSLAWQKLLGIKPVFAYVTDNIDTPPWMNEYCEEIIRYPNWDFIPSAAARTFCARMLLRYRYGDDLCMVSDLDMIPLDKTTFTKFPNTFISDKMLSIGYDVFKHGDGDPNSPPHAPEFRKFPSCYCVATSKVWQEIINPEYLSDIELLQSWVGLNEFDHKEDITKNNFCDESLVRALIQRWNPDRSRIIGVDRGSSAGSAMYRRLDRAHWHIDEKLINSGHYIDAHCPRPLSSYQDSIKKLCDYLGIDFVLPPSS